MPLLGSCGLKLKEDLIKEHGTVGERLYRNYGLLSLSIIKNGEMKPILDDITMA